MRFTTNRLCQLEEESGRTVMDYAADLGEPGKISFIEIRRLLRIAAGEGMTQEQAGDVVDELGATRALAAIAEALQKAFAGDKVTEVTATGKTKAGAA